MLSFALAIKQKVFVILEEDEMMKEIQMVRFDYLEEWKKENLDIHILSVHKIEDTSQSIENVQYRMRI